MCGFDYDRLHEVFFRTDPGLLDNVHGDLPRQDMVINATFAEAIHASSTAPVNYFDAPATWNNGEANFWDGAMGGFNNPVLAGTVDAVSSGVNRADIRVLSIGTASVVLPEAGEAQDPSLVLKNRTQGTVTNIKTAAGCILDDPPDSASYVTHVLLGSSNPSQLVRMNPMIQPVWNGKWLVPNGWTLDDFKYMSNLDMDATAYNDVLRIDNLANLWIQGNISNQGIRSDRWLEVQVGYSEFEKAREAWFMYDSI